MSYLLAKLVYGQRRFQNIGILILFNVRCLNTITNEELSGRKRRDKTWLGHVCQMSTSAMSKTALGVDSTVGARRGGSP